MYQNNRNAQRCNNNKKKQMKKLMHMKNNDLNT